MSCFPLSLPPEPKTRFLPHSDFLISCPCMYGNRGQSIAQTRDARWSVVGARYLAPWSCIPIQNVTQRSHLQDPRVLEDCPGPSPSVRVGHRWTGILPAQTPIESLAANGYIHDGAPKL